jgi:hypothetical protein
MRVASIFDIPAVTLFAGTMTSELLITFRDVPASMINAAMLICA